MNTPLQQLFMKNANMFLAKNDEERYTKMYVCLAAFLEAQQQEEEWTNDQSVLENVERGVQTHNKRYLFLNLLKEYGKESLME